MSCGGGRDDAPGDSGGDAGSSDAVMANATGGRAGASGGVVEPGRAKQDRAMQEKGRQKAADGRSAAEGGQGRASVTPQKKTSPHFAVQSTGGSTSGWVGGWVVVGESASLGQETHQKEVRQSGREKEAGGSGGRGDKTKKRECLKGIRSLLSEFALKGIRSQGQEISLQVQNPLRHMCSGMRESPERNILISFSVCV